MDKTRLKSEKNVVLLSQGKIAFISPEDCHLLCFKWTATKNTHYFKEKWYAYRKVGNHNVYLHRAIMNPPPGYVVDHIDGNGLNNRRSNLRVITQSENVAISNRVRRQYSNN